MCATHPLALIPRRSGVIQPRANHLIHSLYLHPQAVIALGVLRRAGSDVTSQAFVVIKSAQRLSELLHIALRDDDGRLPDDFRESAAIGYDHEASARHRLRSDTAVLLGPRRRGYRWHDHDVRGIHVAPHLFVARIEEHDSLLEAERVDQVLDLPRIRVLVLAELVEQELP